MRRLLLVFLGVILISCSRGASDLSDVGVQLQVSPDPPCMGPATIRVALADANSQPIAGATVELEGNMSHAGMTPVSGAAAETAPGRYEATLEFTMAGDWFIVVRADLPDGRSMERSVPIPSVAPTCGETSEPTPGP